MHTIRTVHMCMYLTRTYKQYIHAFFDSYRYALAHAGSRMLKRPPQVGLRTSHALFNCLCMKSGLGPGPGKR